MKIFVVIGNLLGKLCMMEINSQNQSDVEYHFARGEKQCQYLKVTGKIL